MKIELNRISTIANTEIDLFRNMSSILSANYNVTFIGETHLQRVSFYSNSIKHLATREISDIWIISFSQKLKKARMTFLQAKYHRANLNRQHRTFYGDYFQFELLSQRPILKSSIGRKFKFPKDILSFSCCGSVGAYGVFFNDGKNQIDLAYCSAEYLTTKKVAPTTYRQHTVDLVIPFYNKHNLAFCRVCNSCNELISCFDIDTFTNSILSLEIGAELTHYPNILSFVRSVIQKHNTNLTTNQFITFANNFLQTTETSDEKFTLDGLPINLLIINTDRKEN